jgi:homoserine O-acetyltransferase
MTRPQGIPFTPDTTRNGNIFSPDGPFRMESGTALPSIEIAYTTLGHLNASGTNAVLVCHALTGNAHAVDAHLPEGETIPGWFNGLIGPSRGLDTDRYFVISSNILGSCYGTTGPSSINPATGSAYRMTFPQMTVRDMVRAQKLLVDHLGVRKLVTIIGGSLGGMQALEWAVMYPGCVGSIVPIATAAAHSAWCIGISETQRLAIMNDPAWQGGNYSAQPERGLAIARGIAMITYRSQFSFEGRFGRSGVAAGDGHERVRVFPDVPMSFAVESYLRYQGQKLADRFDANSYLYLTRAMDLHDVSAGRGSVREVLGGVSARVLSIGISSDVLYPPAEQRAIASAIPGAAYAELDSPHGHDAFLIEFEKMNGLLRDFLD